jgi:hypothetical protein
MGAVDFEKVLREGIALQDRLTDLHPVAVGGTAAALHCGHRYSLDVDVVTPQLSARYVETLDRLRTWDAWRTNRQNPPVLILGERHGVELGIRQQRRSSPLQTQVVRGLVVPTAEEMLRIKAYLLAERRMSRDYMDVAALADLLGRDHAREALRTLNVLYPAREAQSALTRLAEACETEPVDQADVDLAVYKGVRTPYNDWDHVIAICRSLSRWLLREELTGGLSPEL